VETPLPPTPTATSVPATATITPTPVPLAATINGEPLTLAEFQAELSLARSAAGMDLAPEEQARVLEDLVERVLLAQGALESGFEIDAAELQERITALENQLGGAEALQAWINASGYTEPEFRAALRREALAAWMRDQVAAAVPQTAEQVHARQILVSSPEEADRVLANLQAGVDFAVLAEDYDPIQGGDLGWFPQGYLPFEAVEAAAFALQPGEFSQAVQTVLGLHIVQVVERDPQRPLEPDARLALQQQAVSRWVAERRSQSEIVFFTP
jgi:parvulin-like peptidyl-prolyl isomerase